MKQNLQLPVIWKIIPTCYHRNNKKGICHFEQPFAVRVQVGEHITYYSITFPPMPDISATQASSLVFQMKMSHFDILHCLHVYYFAIQMGKEMDLWTVRGFLQ